MVAKIFYFGETGQTHLPFNKIMSLYIFKMRHMFQIGARGCESRKENWQVVKETSLREPPDSLASSESDS